MNDWIPLYVPLICFRIQPIWIMICTYEYKFLLKPKRSFLCTFIVRYQCSLKSLLSRLHPLSFPLSIFIISSTSTLISVYWTQSRTEPYVDEWASIYEDIDVNSRVQLSLCSFITKAGCFDQSTFVEGVVCIDSGVNACLVYEAPPIQCTIWASKRARNVIETALWGHVHRSWSPSHEILVKHKMYIADNCCCRSVTHLFAHDRGMMYIHVVYLIKFVFTTLMGWHNQNKARD